MPHGMLLLVITIMNIIKNLIFNRVAVCVLENGSNLHINECRKKNDTITLGLLNRKKNAKLRFFTSRGKYVNALL